MSQFTVTASVRSDMGKGASRRLRRESGNVPAILYGGKEEPTNLALAEKDLLKLLENESFFSTILDLNIDGTPARAILKDLQRHPAKPQLLHADFQRVVDDQPIKIRVPLHFINEDKCAAIKMGGKASHSQNEVEILCLPKDLPEYLEVDMKDVEVGQIVHLSDITLPEGVQIAALRLGADHDQAIANIARKRGK